MKNKKFVPLLIYLSYGLFTLVDSDSDPKPNGYVVLCRCSHNVLQCLQMFELMKFLSALTFKLHVRN